MAISFNHTIVASRDKRQSAEFLTELFGLPDHALYRERWPLLETAPRAWTQLVPGNAVHRYHLPARLGIGHDAAGNITKA